MVKEEYIMQLSMMEQQARELQQQLHLINQKRKELDILHLSLERIEQSKEKEFLAPLGEGIFIKSKIEEKELFMNVGSKIMVKKNPKEVQSVIVKQNKQLEGLKEKMEHEIETINNNLQTLLKTAQKEEHAQESIPQENTAQKKKSKKK